MTRTLTPTAARLPPPHSAKGTGVTDAQALVAEAVFTFALCHTVLHVATSAVQEGNSYYGLAIGFTVLAGAVSVGGVSGGAFNPAVAMLSLVRLTYSSAFSDGALTVVYSMRDAVLGGAWIHIAGPMGGGLLAGLLFRITHPVCRSAAPSPSATRVRCTHSSPPSSAVCPCTEPSGRWPSDRSIGTRGSRALCHRVGRHAAARVHGRDRRIAQQRLGPRAPGDRLHSDGPGLRGRGDVGRALQPGGDRRRLAASCSGSMGVEADRASDGRDHVHRHAARRSGTRPLRAHERHLP